MWALVTGASSGIGRDMARILAKRGYDLILAARREERLLELAKELPVRTEVVCCDLADAGECRRLYEFCAGKEVQILVNNAGFGLFGAFEKADLEREMQMIDTNIRAVHILTKLFLRDFVRRDDGYILNVASSAAFFPGPLLSVYYATKSYVFRLTEAVHEELRREGSRVYIGALCPGPVRTEFDQTADVRFSVKGLSSQEVAEYAIRNMFRRKMLMIPGIVMKLAKFFGRFASEGLTVRLAYHMQKRKK